MLVHMIWDGSKQLEYSLPWIESASRFIPPGSKMRGIEFLVTPDLVLIHTENKATVYELTCPTNTKKAIYRLPDRRNKIR